MTVERTSRVDYIRQMDDGRVKTPGENPYREEFGMLERNEMMRLIHRHAVPSKKHERKQRGDNRITWHDLTAMAEIREINSLMTYIGGDSKALNRREKQRLSRILQLIDSGKITMIEGEPVVLFEPKPMPQEHQYHLRMVPDGRGGMRPTITPGRPEKMEVMPQFFRDFKLPGTA
jgi:hypothetical protein